MHPANHSSHTNFVHYFTNRMVEKDINQVVLGVLNSELDISELNETFFGIDFEDQESKESN